MTFDARGVLLGAESCYETRLVAARDDEPVTTIASDASQSAIGGLEVTGGRAGIMVKGARGVEIRAWVHDVEGPGIVFDGSTSAASGTVTGSWIEGTRGEGIAVYGGGQASEPPAA